MDMIMRASHGINKTAKFPNFSFKRKTPVISEVYVYLVEKTGIEPVASCVQSRRSPI